MRRNEARIRVAFVVASSCALALAWPARSTAADRQIGIDPMLSVHWSTLTGGPTTPAATMGNHMMVGFWQRSSGAKAGVGSINTGVVEFQLPENSPQRIRAATLQFRARASQCAGGEPVVFEVFGFAGNGQPDPADAISGQRLAQLTSNCTDNPAFTQVIDVSNLVRQLSVPSGLRFAGFNVRKMNHRAGPSLFGFSAAKLTIVVADQDVAAVPNPANMGTTAGAPTAAGGAPATGSQVDVNRVIGGLLGAAGTLMRGGGEKPARDQAGNEAAAILSNPPMTSSDTGAASSPTISGTSPAGGEVPVAAATPAVGAAAATSRAVAAVNVDIVGIKLGMSFDEVKRALQAHSPAMRVDEARGIVNNVAATDYLSWVVARGNQRGTDGSGDAIGVQFPPPPNAHRAIFVERFTGFQANQYPLFETLRQALVQKYGAPSFASEGVMLWTFNAAGVQIVDNNVNARCAKFPPTDPPARGQNVLFNGYKTAGCGPTVFVRYERNRGPSDRDLVRWMSVSLVDDSQFEDMRQAAARFATQATRDAGSRVAAPKL